LAGQSQASSDVNVAELKLDSAFYLQLWMAGPGALADEKRRPGRRVTGLLQPRSANSPGAEYRPAIRLHAIFAWHGRKSSGGFVAAMAASEGLAGLYTARLEASACPFDRFGFGLCSAAVCSAGARPERAVSSLWQGEALEGCDGSLVCPDLHY